jgi:hypothetical protein
MTKRRLGSICIQRAPVYLDLARPLVVPFRSGRPVTAILSRPDLFSGCCWWVQLSVRIPQHACSRSAPHPAREATNLRLLAARERVVSRERLPFLRPRLSFVSMVANAKPAGRQLSRRKRNGTMHVIERGRGNGQLH